MNYTLLAVCANSFNLKHLLMLILEGCVWHENMTAAFEVYVSRSALSKFMTCILRIIIFYSKKTRSVWNNMEQATFGVQIRGMLWKWFHVSAFVGTFTGKLSLRLQIFADYLKITVEMKFNAFKGSKDHRWIVAAVAF